MKTKSKLVLGLSILSAATLAAGATSTFAWMTATGSSLSASQTAQVATATKSTLAAIQMDIAWTEVAQTGIEHPLTNLVMTAKQATALTKAYNAQGQGPYDAVVPTGKATYAELTITITSAANIDSLKGLSCDVKVDATSRVKVGTATSGDSGNVYNAVAGASVTVGTLKFVEDGGTVKLSNDGGSTKAAKNEGVQYTVYVAISGDYDGTTAMTTSEGNTAPTGQQVEVSFGTLS